MGAASGSGVGSGAALFRQLWQALGEAPAPPVRFLGPRDGLASVYDVSGLAAATIGAATAAVSEWIGLEAGTSPPPVSIDRTGACVAFHSERHLASVGWELPATWDAVAGDYRCADGFIRLHTNYGHHRRAVLATLGVPADRQVVTEAVARWRAEPLEAAIVAAGGCAARLRTRQQWCSHPQGRAVASEPLCAALASESSSRRDSEERPRAARQPAASVPPGPLAGVRVLDLTRVLAGPICTRFLAAYGADVLRIDPPDFDEVPAALPDTTPGKRRARLDLKRPEGRACFKRLAADADVLVVSYRNGALERLGLDRERLWALCPGLVIGRVAAYGHTGPWAERRGFDSLVQMSCGIAAVGQLASGDARPRPLPAQALDHGTGYALAAAVVRALSARRRDGRARELRLSLARMAELLCTTEGPGLAAAGSGAPSAPDPAPYLEQADSGFGPLRRVAPPGGIAGVTPLWRLPAGPLGTDPPSW